MCRWSLEVEKQEKKKAIYQIPDKNAAWPGKKFDFPHNLLVLKRFRLVLTKHTDHDEMVLILNKTKNTQVCGSGM